MTADIHAQIRQHLIDAFLFDDPDMMVHDDESLLDNGIIDSTGVLDLIEYVEIQFGIRVADQEVTPANFDSVSRIAAYVQAQQPLGIA